jgi:ABC-type transport system substrate-binding protein
MNIKHKVVGVAVASALAFVGSGPASAAQVQPSAANPVLVSTTVVPMVITGFDPQVAIAHGYKVVYDETGTPRLADSSLIPGQKTASGLVTPMNQVDASCGSSWVYLYDIGDKKYRVDTGFAVIFQAVSYSWTAPVGGYPHSWGGGLFWRTSWSASAVGLVQYGGRYLASANGWAMSDTGFTCRSTGPLDSELIY